MQINGKPYDWTRMTAGQLIQSLGLKADRIVLEVSGTIVAKDQLDAFIILENDTVEIVSFVGGG